MTQHCSICGIDEFTARQRDKFFQSMRYSGKKETLCGKCFDKKYLKGKSDVLDKIRSKYITK